MKRPYVILNAAMTLDGKIATVARDSEISSKVDLIRLHKLRAEVDAVMVGAGTVLADDPSLTVRRVRGKNPIRVVVDGEAKIPVNAKILNRSAKTIVAVLSTAKKQKIDKLRAAGAEIIIFDGATIDLLSLLEGLYSGGVRKLLLEGGSTLNWYMLERDLVDEVQVAVSPRIVGGELAKTLVGGKGFSKIKNGVELKLFNVKRIGNEILLVYRVMGAGRA